MYRIIYIFSTVCHAPVAPENGRVNVALQSECKESWSSCETRWPNYKQWREFLKCCNEGNVFVDLFLFSGVLIITYSIYKW